MKKRTKWMFFLGLFLLAFYIIFRAPLPFKKAQWEKRCRQTFPLHIPNRMADRLIQTDVLTGKNAQELVGFLGEPKPFRQWKGNDFVYCLGTQRGIFPVDNEWLIIDLDDSGRVSKVKIVSD